MRQSQLLRQKILYSLLAWTVGIAIFFPILWTILTSFKTELEAVANDPSFLFFDWTLDNYQTILNESRYFSHFWNSIVISLGSSVIGLLIAIPAAWAWPLFPESTPKTC